MSKEIIDKAKEKKAFFEKMLAEARQTIVELQARLPAIQSEVDKWSSFVAQWEMLSTEGPGKSKLSLPLGKIKLKKGTIPAGLARLMLDAPNHTMRVATLAEELKKDGTLTTDNYVNISYTTLNRRQDLFEKVSPGTFKLRNLEFEIVD